MNVSELARAAGLSPSGVRWYERIGVLPRATRQANGYRAYTEHDRRLMQLVGTLRRIGLAPAEAGRIAKLLLDGRAVGPEVEATLAGHREAIRRQLDELKRLDLEINDLERTIAETVVHRPPVASKSRIEVLFLCNSNSGRSQMGEALLSRLGGNAFDVCSAGISPKPISPFTVRALLAAGIDWSSAREKSVEQFRHRRFDYVVTLSDSARDDCPVLAGPHNTLHWGLADPGAVQGSEEERLAAYEATIDMLSQRLRPFRELALVAHGLDDGAGNSR